MSILPKNRATILGRGAPAGSSFQPVAGALSPAVRTAASTMGRYTDTATTEMRNKQLQAESLIGGQVGAMGRDPMWQAARQMAYQRAQNPGIEPGILDRIRGRVAASSAASAASGARGLTSQIARRNISGPAAVAAMQLNQNRAGINRSNGILDVDKWGAETAMADKNSASAQLAGLIGQQYGMDASLTGQLASTKMAYNPLSWMGQIQQLMSPVGEIARGQALSAGSNATNPVALNQAAPVTQAEAAAQIAKKPATPIKDYFGDSGYIIDKNGVKQPVAPPKRNGEPDAGLEGWDKVVWLPNHRLLK